MGVFSAETHVSFKIGSDFKNVAENQLHPCTWAFVNMGAIFGIFETCPNCSLGSLEKVGVFSAETHFSFEFGSGFKNVAENH